MGQFLKREIQELDDDERRGKGEETLGSYFSSGFRELSNKTYRYKLMLNKVNNEMADVNRFYISLDNNEALTGYNNELCYLNFFYAVLLFVAALTNFLIQVNI